jgi:hypothetical protein
MGVARLLAKGWVAFCLFAGGYALADPALAAGSAAASTAVILFLFGAMGLLFISGYGAAASIDGRPFLARLKPHHVLPGFNELVFIAFALTVFVVQTVYLSSHIDGGVFGALQAALRFAVPGEERLTFALGSCGLDGGRMFASALSWLLAFVFLGSSISRIRLLAGIVRLERKDRPEALGPGGVALILGVSAVIGIQLLYVGSLYPLLPCHVVQGILGDILVGPAPLMLSYLIVAAIVNLIAMGPEA